jgi:hypothetical protein
LIAPFWRNLRRQVLRSAVTTRLDRCSSDELFGTDVGRPETAEVS